MENEKFVPRKKHEKRSMNIENCVEKANKSAIKVYCVLENTFL